MRRFWVHNSWWVKRLALLPVHLAVFAVAVFFLVRLMPGDPVLTIAGNEQLTPGQYEEIREALGMSGSLFSQFVSYVARIATLDLGTSLIDGSDVLDQIATRLPSTMEIAVLAMIVSVTLAVVSGILVLLRPHNVIARGVSVWGTSAGAVPDFCIGVVGIMVFYSFLRWAPAPIGRYDPLLSAPPRITGFPLADAALSGDTVLLASMIQHLWLPVLVLALGSTPTLLKGLLRALHRSRKEDSTLFRIATGAPRAVVLASIMRRALPTMVTMLGTVFGFLLGGAIIIERLFSIPGMGQFAINAVNRSDLVALQGFLIVVGAVTLVLFLLVDVANMLLDPRRRPGAAIEGVSA